MIVADQYIITPYDLLGHLGVDTTGMMEKTKKTHFLRLQSLLFEMRDDYLAAVEARLRLYDSLLPKCPVEQLARVDSGGSSSNIAGSKHLKPPI